jgi:hypothetical protein
MDKSLDAAGVSDNVIIQMRRIAGKAEGMREG